MLAGRRTTLDGRRTRLCRRGLVTTAAALSLAATLGACGATGDEGAAVPGLQTSSPTSASPSSTASAPAATSSTSTATTSSSAPTTATTKPTTTTPTTTATPTASGTTSAAAITAHTTLRPGMSGAYVLAAQQRLSSLGYWLGSPDGEYGGNTSQAVMALQKAAGLGRDGVLGPRTKAALERGVRPRPRTTSGSAIEVDKKSQLVMVVLGGKLRYVLNTSTGSGRPYTSGGQDYVAVTPEGRFSIQRQIDGERVSQLGVLWRPKYFTGGYALHGSPSVPGFPASHGCVRLSNPAIDFLWSSGTAPIGRTVWVY